MVLVDCELTHFDQVRSNNVTVSGATTEVVGKQQGGMRGVKKGNSGGKRKAKDVAAEWQAALGPYPVVSPGTRWGYSQSGKYIGSAIQYSTNRMKSKYFSQIIFDGREASFVHAISSAGVAHAVTRSCSSGPNNHKTLISLIINQYSS